MLSLRFDACGQDPLRPMNRRKPFFSSTSEQNKGLAGSPAAEGRKGSALKYLHPSAPLASRWTDVVFPRSHNLSDRVAETP